MFSVGVPLLLLDHHGSGQNSIHIEHSAVRIVIPAPRTVQLNDLIHSSDTAETSTTNPQHEQNIEKINDDLNSNDTNHDESDITTDPIQGEHQDNDQTKGSTADATESESVSSNVDNNEQNEEQSDALDDNNSETAKPSSGVQSDAGSDAVDNLQEENFASAYGFRAMVDAAAA
ncbi:hypothetical protein [Bifidobacterium tsurumiense]|uniref:hypothetical protein n=1 Tax=Bifidobacterium tsurumiense TaxID=356829 RepID=UPI0018A6CF0A|nr:hypothetical protein [Bifidobacterium tsurumiense]